MRRGAAVSDAEASAASSFRRDPIEKTVADPSARECLALPPQSGLFVAHRPLEHPPAGGRFRIDGDSLLTSAIGPDLAGRWISSAEKAFLQSSTREKLESVLGSLHAWRVLRDLHVLIVLRLLGDLHTLNVLRVLILERSLGLSTLLSAQLWCSSAVTEVSVPTQRTMIAIPFHQVYGCDYSNPLVTVGNHEFLVSLEGRDDLGRPASKIHRAHSPEGVGPNESPLGFAAL